MSLLDEAHINIFKEYVQAQLTPICEADPNVLSDYIIALLRHDMEGEHLKQYCKEQLEDFLRDDTSDFVEKIFDAIATQSFFPKPESPKPIPPSPPKVDVTINSEQNGSSDSQFSHASKQFHPSHSLNKPGASFNPALGSDITYPPSVSDSDLPLQKPVPSSIQPPSRPAHISSMQPPRNAPPPFQHRRQNDPSSFQHHPHPAAVMNQPTHSHMPQAPAPPPQPAPTSLQSTMIRPQPQPRTQIQGRMSRRGLCHEFLEKGTCSRRETCPYEHIVPRQLPPQANNGYGHHSPAFELADSVIHPSSHALNPPAHHYHQNSPSHLPPHSHPSPYPPSQTPQPPFTAYPPRPVGPSYTPNVTHGPPIPPLSAQLESRIRPHAGGVNVQPHQQRDSPSSIASRLGHRDAAAPKTQLRGTFHPKSVPNSAIVVDGIPYEHCRVEAIQSFFSKFGHVEHVQLIVPEQRAVVYYKTIEEAKLAHSSPEPIFGNRFIKVYFFHPDRHQIEQNTSNMYPPASNTSMPTSYGPAKPVMNPPSSMQPLHTWQQPSQPQPLQQQAQLPSLPPTSRKPFDSEAQKLAEAMKKEQLDRELDMISQQIQLAAKATSTPNSSSTVSSSTTSYSSSTSATASSQASYVGYSFAFTDMMYAPPPMPEIYLPPTSSSLVNWDHVKSRYSLDLRPSIVIVTYPDLSAKESLLEQFHNFGELDNVTELSTEPTNLQLELRYKTRTQAEKAFQFGPTLPGFTSTIQVAWKS